MSKLEQILCILFLLPTIINGAQAESLDEIRIHEAVLKKLTALKYANVPVGIYQGEVNSALKERLEKGFSSGIIQPFTYEVFQNCKRECEKKFKKTISSKKNPLFVPENSFIENFYTDQTHQIILGQVVYSKPLTFIVNNELYISPSADPLYKEYFNLSGEDNSTYLLPPVIPDGEKGTTMWLPWIKKLAYFKPNSFITPGMVEGVKKEGSETCIQDSYRRGFTGKPKLYDLDGSILSKEQITEYIITGYYTRKDDIIFYVTKKTPKKSNEIDGVRVIPNYLLTYPYERDLSMIRMYKDDLIDQNGNATVYQILEVEHSYRVTCPASFPDTILSKLKSGKIKFKDVPEEFKQDTKTVTINYECNSNAIPACADEALDAFTPQ